MPRNTTPEYKAWIRMRSRVNGSANKASARNYQQRGIGVCDRWNSFDLFLADVGPRPSGCWLDRINNDGNYEPGNVRWATPTVQQRNRRGNRMLTFNGRTQCTAAWAEELGINRLVIGNRLSLGWSAERALTEPVNKRTT